MPADAGTRLVALLGDPVAHSLSPRIQNAAIRVAGLDAVYLALRCDAEHLGLLLRGIARAGGAGNVTIPHKPRAAALLERSTRAVERTGACNTFWLDEHGRIAGDNTDVEGFAEAARTLIGSPAGARVLILGAGGAAHAALLALLDQRADAVHILARTPARAAEARDRLQGGRRVTILDGADRLRREGYDLVVNATPLGLRPDDPAPIALDRVARVGAVLDMTYRREAHTALVADALRAGIPAADGIPMLLHQASAAFRLWFRVDPDVEAMRAALDTPSG